MSLGHHFAAIAFLAASGMATQASAKDLSDQQASLVLARAQGGVTTYEAVLASLTQPIRLYDTDRNGLDQADLDLVDQTKAAGVRSMVIAGYLRFDLNNDQKVTRAEFDRVSQIATDRQAMPMPMPNSKVDFDSVDRNGDKALTFDEMGDLQNLPVNSPARMIANGGYSGGQVDRTAPSLLTTLDPNGDGVFTLDEARLLTDQVFAKLDADKDGVISQAERSKTRMMLPD